MPSTVVARPYLFDEGSEATMSGFRIVKDYPQSVEKVWAALTDPAVVPLWTTTGRGGRPEGFKTEVGTKFKLIGRPFPGWDGVVRCEVLAVDEPRMLKYDWRNKETDRPTIVTNSLSELPDGGTQLTWEHAEFRGLGGQFMSRLLGRVRRKMLTEGLPAVLNELEGA